MFQIKLFTTAATILITIGLLTNNIKFISATVMPSFDRLTENVTVIIGNSVVLPCFISNLGDHKVSDQF